MKSANLAFDERYIPEPNSGCFIWIGAVDKNGYGTFTRNQYPVKAHREAWKLAHSDPGKLWVLHQCDNPSCVNPDHLFLGTAADNTADMDMKGRRRSVHSEQHALTKLNVEQVLAIRSDPRSQRKIAADYEIGATTVFHIKKRRNWKYIP